MNSWASLFLKDMRVEFRTGASFVPLLTLSLLLTSFFGLGITSFVSDQRTLQFLFHPLIWGIFLFSGAFTVTRLFESDRQAGLVAGYSLFRIPLFCFFIAKTFFITLILFCNHVLSTLFLAAFFNLSLQSIWGSYFLLSGIVAIGYSALATLVSGIVLQQTSRAILLPLIFLPLLFPLFFAVVEVSISVVMGSGVLGAGGWFSLLIALSTGYLLAGVLLFDVVVRD